MSSRAVIRRMKRELESRGIGLGWRYTTNGRRKYLVIEPPERTLEYLEAESAAKGWSAEERVGG